MKEYVVTYQKYFLLMNTKLNSEIEAFRDDMKIITIDGRCLSYHFEKLHIYLMCCFNDGSIPLDRWSFSVNSVNLWLTSAYSAASLFLPTLLLFILFICSNHLSVSPYCNMNIHSRPNSKQRCNWLALLSKFLVS